MKKMKIANAYINAQMDADSWGYSGPPKNARRILEILGEISNEFGLVEETEAIGFAENGSIFHPPGSTAVCRNFCAEEIELENGEFLDQHSAIEWFGVWREHGSSRDFERNLRKLMQKHAD